MRRVVTPVPRKDALLKAGASPNAILNSANFSSTATDEEGVGQIFNIGAERKQAEKALLKMMNEVLDLAWIESGKLSLSKESLPLAELMSECHAMLEPQAQQAGIRMTFPTFDNPMFVVADWTRLKQIILNLVSNAIQYNKEHGTVAVDCVASSPERIRISVADTGAGLAPDKLAQLFQPFHRLGQEDGSVAGRGIGLVVSKRLAELMQGAIGVESALGVGSVFWCELIASSAPQLKLENIEFAAEAPMASSADSSKRTVLYVEDNPANMELVQDIIAQIADMALVTAVNGTLGIMIARATRPRVILMDINLPGIRAIKALKILRDDPVTANIPVIALSANAKPRDMEKGMEAGFFSYVTKPIQIKEFMHSLTAALEFAEEKRAKTPDAGPLP